VAEELDHRSALDMSDWIWSSVYELIDARELAYETTQEMRNERAFPRCQSHQQTFSSFRGMSALIRHPDSGQKRKANLIRLGQFGSSLVALARPREIRTPRDLPPRDLRCKLPLWHGRF
jgi:hypothetical protein